MIKLGAVVGELSLLKKFTQLPSALPPETTKLTVFPFASRMNSATFGDLRNTTLGF
jgi:hypothetical protein